MSNTLEVMKEFFMKSGYLGKDNEQTNRPKHRQGRGDRDLAARGKNSVECTNSDTTIYKNVLNRIETLEVDDPEIILRLPVNIESNDETERIILREGTVVHLRKE